MLLVGTFWIISKKIILQFFVRSFVYSRKNNIKMFWYYSHNILIRLFVGNRAKGRTSKRVFQENKTRQIFRKTNISYPLIRCVSEGKKCSLFGKFGVLSFLETPVLRFALLPYYCRIERLLSMKDRWNICYFWRQFIENGWKNKVL